MPIPAPRSGESEETFISRCMGDSVMVADYTDEKQRAAVCYAQIEKKKTKTSKRNRQVTLEGRSDLLRTETMDGKTYLVAPVVPVVEGVHNGEYMSYEEISVFPEMWDGRPLPIDHPKDENSDPATAGSPEVMENSVIGFLFNVVARPDIKGISGELWIDTAKAATVPGGAETLEKLQSGQGLEVSTAYYCFIDNVPGEWLNPNTGVLEKFTSTQTQARPDHLALLPFDIGACNWEDGCGAPRINKSEKSSEKIDHELNSLEMAATTNAASTARRPSFSGTETSSWGDVDKSFGAYAKAHGSGDITDVKNAPAALKKWIASKTLLGDETASTTDDLIKFPVVNPGTGKLNKGALNAVLGGRGAQASISAEALDSARAEAHSLLKSEFGESMPANKAAKIKINGDRLENTLKAAIDASTATGGTSTEMIHRLAVAVGVDAGKMQQLIDGNLDYVPKGWLEIIAAVLDLDQWDLFMAASSDNYDAQIAPDDDEDDTMTANKEKKIASADATLTTSHNDGKACAPCQKTLKAKMLEILQSLGLVKVAANEEVKEIVVEPVVTPAATPVTPVVNSKTKEEKAADLIDSTANPFSSDDADWLKGLTHDQLDTLKDMSESQKGPDEAGPGATDPDAEGAGPGDEDDKAPAKADKTNTAAVTPVIEVKEVIMTKEQILETLGIDETVLAAAKTINADKATARNAKIAEIKAIAKCPYTEAELSTLSDASLDKTLEMLQPERPFRVASYAKTKLVNDEDLVTQAPAILTAKPGVKGVDYAVQTVRNASRGVN